MTAANYPIYIEQGATWTTTFIYALVATVDEEGVPISWDPVDISTAGIRMQIRAAYGEDPLIDVSVGEGITIDDGSEGKFTIVLSEDLTDSLEEIKRARYDVEIYDSTWTRNPVRRIFEGVVTISPNITRDDE